MSSINSSREFPLSRSLLPRTIIFAAACSTPALLVIVSAVSANLYISVCLYVFTVLIWLLSLSLNKIMTYITEDELVMTDMGGRRIRVSLSSITSIEVIPGFWGRVFGGPIIRVRRDGGNNVIVGPFADTDGFLDYLSEKTGVRPDRPSSSS